jgi:hypothetical protein
VLSVLDPKSSVIAPGDVCSAPFIEDTVKDIPSYIRQAIAAVGRVRDPNLRNMKAACLSVLKKS